MLSVIFLISRLKQLSVCLLQMVQIQTNRQMLTINIFQRKSIVFYDIQYFIPNTRAQILLIYFYLFENTQMLEGFMRQTPKNRKNSSSPPKKQISPKKNISIPQLKELENQIIMNKPNNTIQYIRDWANSKLMSFNIAHQKFNVQSDDEQDLQPFVLKNIASKLSRRFAVFVNNAEFAQNTQKKRVVPKLEQTKSMILIKLRKMEILKTLTNEQLWEIVEQFQEVQYGCNQCIIRQNQPVQTFYIIIAGIVFRKEAHKKPIQLVEGTQFGQDSILFGLPSVCEYECHGNCRIATISGRIISRFVRESNIKKYNILMKAIGNIEYFKTLHEDQMDKIADLSANQNHIQTEILQQINLLAYPTSFFIVLKGNFNEYSRKLTEQLRKQPDKVFGVGDSFGLQCLYGQQSDKVIISQDYGTIVQVKCNDIERLIDPLAKLVKRRKRRM